jgi:Peptidase M66
VFNILRLTIGIGLLMSLVTACQSNPQSSQNQTNPDPTTPGQPNPGQTNPGQANPGQPVPGFNLSLDASSLNLTQGDMADVTIKLERLNGFAQAVTLSLKNLPADVTASPASLAIAAGASSTTLHLVANGNANIGSGAVTVEAVSGTLQKSASLNLATVKPDPSRPDLFLKRIEWGQSVIKSDLRLIPGKSAVLMAHVNATKVGISGITVRATATANGTTLGTLDLTAPANVPVTDSAAANATDLTSTYWSIVPKDWIRQGLEVKLEVDAGRNLKESNEANNTQILKPTIGAGSKLYLMMVPLIENNHAVLTLDAAAVAAIRTGLMAIWPFADVDIKVREPYTVKAEGHGLEELSALRNADNSKRYYYGFEGSCCGVGYVGYPIAVGNENIRTISHELGHNLGQLHAPCPGMPDFDANYPFKDGNLGTWGFDPRNNTLIDPSKNYDLMSYCGREWVSEYMYGRVQSFVEKNPSTASFNANTSGDVSGDVSGKASAAASGDLLLISGSINAGQVSLEPIQRISGTASTPTAGTYSLLLETATGTRQVSFEVHRLTHEDGTGKVFDKAHFSFTMPDPGSISKVTITENNVVKLERSTGGRLSAQSAQATTAQPITVQRNGSSVTVNWDARAYSSVAVAHIAPDGTRTTLALGLTGGTATLELGTLGAGQFEVSASDGLNGIKQRF